MPFSRAYETPFLLFSSLKRRVINRAIPTGSVPTVKRNCMVSGGISREPSFERSAHAPQQSTHRMEYQNHRDFKASRKAIQRTLLPIKECRMPELIRECSLVTGETIQYKSSVNHFFAVVITMFR